MQKQDIEIVIDPKGEVTFQVKGVKGTDCLVESAFLERALGGEVAVLDQQRTAEFYETAEERASSRVGTGRDGGGG